MNEVIVPASQLPALPYARLVVPSLVADQGERAAKRYVEFFAANIRNPNTRRAYARAATDFLGWCEQRGPSLPGIEPMWTCCSLVERRWISWRPFSRTGWDL
jgi:hypothetical protein